MNEYTLAVVGVGCVGSLIAHILNKSGIEPYLIFRTPEKARFAKELGIKIEVDSKVWNIRGVFTSYDNLPEVINVAFICTKAYDSTAAIANLLRNTKRIDLIVMCQNGIGSYEEATKLFDPDNIAILVLNAGVHRVGPGYYKVVGFSTSYLGQIRAKFTSKFIGEVVNYLKPLKVLFTQDIEPYRWLKLLINAAINPVTAILRARNGVIIENSYARDIAINVIREGLEITRSLGIKLPRDPIEELFTVAKATRSNISSMLQDIMNKKRTEIDYINGVIVRYGRELNIRTPTNEVLYDLIKALERAYLQ